MKFWLDANLDPTLAPWLGSRFDVMVAHVRELTLERALDNELFDAARRLQIDSIITKDADLVDIVLAKGIPPQIIRMTCGNLSTPAMHVLLARTFGSAIELLRTGVAWVEIG